MDSSGAPSGDSIGFSVHEPSVLRVFGQTRAAGYDLDMILYSSGNDDATGVLFVSVRSLFERPKYRNLDSYCVSTCISLFTSLSSL